MSVDLDRLHPDLRPLARQILADARDARYSVADLIRFSGASTYDQQALHDVLGDSPRVASSSTHPNE